MNDSPAIVLHAKYAMLFIQSTEIVIFTQHPRTTTSPLSKSITKTQMLKFSFQHTNTTHSHIHTNQKSL